MVTIWPVCSASICPKSHKKSLACVTAKAEPVALAAEALACVDVMAALGELAVTRRYVRPSVDASYAFAIEGGRHPVVEAALERGGNGPFVANDCHLDPANEIEGAGRLWLLTGPNMAGKSTFLRQNALIALMAQVGSFVPAAAARIGVVNRLFSRVGASDDAVEELRLALSAPRKKPPPPVEAQAVD